MLLHMEVSHSTLQSTHQLTIPVTLDFILLETQVATVNVMEIGLECNLHVSLIMQRLGFSNWICILHNVSTVDREIFAVKIIRVLNFCFKNNSPPDGSTM